MAATKPLRIGGACAFWGDSNRAVEQLVSKGNVDVLVFDYLAELTLSIMASARARNPNLGYATDFVKAVAPLLPEIIRRGTLLLSNAGGINPQACAKALRAAADAAGVNLRIAVVEGDDILTNEAEVRAVEVREVFANTPLPETLTSMNAYLGASPIAEALRRGVNVVITGRCVDSALALGALIHHFNWTPDDYDRMAAGSLVGHMLECTTQTTGGLFTDWWKVPGWDDMGYPIAECHEDGTFELTKPSGTGGLIAPLVAAEQMLYEVSDPSNYQLPDVNCDFTAVRIDHTGNNAVRFSGARGSAPTPTYKVSGTWLDGFRLSTTLTFVGENAIQMGRRALEAVVTRARRIISEAGYTDFTGVSIEVLGSEIPSYGASAKQGAREVVVRLAAHHGEAKALEILASEVAPMGIAGAPGTTGFSGRQKAQAVFRLFSFLWPKSKVDVRITIDNEVIHVPFQAAATEPQVNLGQRYNYKGSPPKADKQVTLAALAVARSGDKGDRAHIAIIARKPQYARVIGEQLTVEAVKLWFAHLVKGDVHRYDVPGIHAYNYVLDQALGGGGSASLRNDPLGKTFGQILLSYPISVPNAWLRDLEPGFAGSVAGED
jgi:hypothetical protein